MTGRLSGKTALCTAAARGIGRATALAFAKEGARVVATDILEDEIEALARESEAITARRLDVRDTDAVKALAAEIGALDVLFNCAGFVHHGTILECEEKDWELAFDLNVKSMYRTMRSFLPAMLEKGGGSVVNMSSAASSIAGAPNRFVYGATKAAVIGLTRATARDFVGRGLRCNCICPGTVDTPSLQGRIDAFDDPVQAREDFIARQPMGRLGTAEEIAALAVYLASDESAFVTGTAMVIDGGWTL